MQLVDVFRARIVDVSNNSFIIEITGDEEKIEGFIDVMRPWGIIEMVRTGIVSMARGAVPLYPNGNNGNGYHSETKAAGFSMPLTSQTY